jgi:FixJ family two-component response regulator
MPAGKKQIFVVDDDESVCRALSVLLGTYGFAVDTFTSAETFFLVVPNSVPGCLILDLHMPGLDGWGTLQHLRASGSGRPVIVITADKNGGVREQALRIGAARVLHKPFNDQALVDLIARAFEKKDSTDKTRK